MELRQAIDKAIGRTALAMEHSDFIAESCAESVLFKDKVLTPFDELDKIKKVTLTDIKQVASEVFEESRLNLSLVGPFKDEDQFKQSLKI